MCEIGVYDAGMVVYHPRMALEMCILIIVAGVRPVDCGRALLHPMPILGPLSPSLGGVMVLRQLMVGPIPPSPKQAHSVVSEDDRGGLFPVFVFCSLFR